MHPPARPTPESQPPQPPLRPYQGAEPFLFASYAHADAATVYPELTRLDQAGFRIWYDEGIKPTEEWIREIADAIAAASLVLVFLSPQAIASSWVRKEISFALKKGKKILPVYLEPLKLPDDLELQLGNIQALERFRLAEDEYRHRLQHLLEAVEGVNRREPAAEQQKLERELELAFRVQQSFFPRQMPSVPGYEFWASFLPARSLSGDYLHVSSTPAGAVAVLLTEVAGKGVPSALCSAMLAGAVSVALPAQGDDLPGLLATLDRLCRSRFTDLDRFATVLAVRLEPADGLLSVVSAGAGAPILRRADGSLAPWNATAAGPPLGTVDDGRFEVAGGTLAPGDSLFLSNASVADISRESKEFYGQERLLAAVRGAGGGPREIAKAVIADVSRFLGDRPLQDDFTVAVVGRNPAQ
jgi:sigma-B regulation protein RsbU (phosphoserine phosphatase)